MRIVCIGGGPAGLTFALLLKKLDPGHEVVVFERSHPEDTSGWGVVFSDATMQALHRGDRETAAAIEASFSRWDDIVLEIGSRTLRCGGHGFAGIARKRLLDLLRARCETLGVRLEFGREVRCDDELPEADLIVAADGLNSAMRARHADLFAPDVVERPNRYLWLGTRRRHDAFTFVFEKTEHGWLQAHVYPFDKGTSTFIVECPEEVWRAHGLDRLGQAHSIAFCERAFARHLSGARLMGNAHHRPGSPWMNFQRVRCERWWHAEGRAPLVLMGDAAHTAHFAIGSGTKLAMEDALELANQFKLREQAAGKVAPADLPALLHRYQQARAVEVQRLQNAAWNAMAWFEACGTRYCDQLEPEQLLYSLLTRSQRIGHESLRMRDAGWLEGYERWFAHRAWQDAGLPGRPGPVAAGGGDGPPVPPMFTPYRARSVVLKNRVVVSPMAQYSAIDGTVGDYHLVHLGARAMGGAALVMAEMTCVSPDARITPACPGLWNDAQRDAWARVVDWVHDHTDAAIGLQLGHAGAKGATHLGWEGMDQPLTSGGWPLVSASPQQYLPDVSDWSRQMRRPDMDRVIGDFAAAARRAAEAGFDWLELHCAHGYLLSSFISPLTNRREDEYGGPLANRLRYPLEVFAAVRAAWPGHLPMSVRISAHDWVEGGITPADAVEIARAFKDAGADLLDCSSGQVSKAERPSHGRMWQTPFSDRIRNEAGVATIAVGAISEADHVNAIIAAGRADLCAIGRPHLANPAWTLCEAARIGYAGIAWPAPYRTARPQLEAAFRRAKGSSP